MAQIITKVRNPFSFIIGLATESCESDLLREHIAHTNQVVSKSLKAALAPLVSRSSSLRNAIQSSLVTKRDYDRAWFTRLGYESVSHNWGVASHALVAAELSYASIVILDDIVDQGKVRFGKSCLYRKIGVDAAIYVAEMLRSLSSTQLLQTFKHVDLSHATMLEVLERNERTLCDINYGQYLDVTSSGQEPSTFSDADYLELVHFTTGVDIANCFAIGALLAKASKENMLGLERIGSIIGIMLQIRDDLLDYAPLPEDVDKTTGCDFAKLRMKLPYLVAHRFASPSDKAILESAKQSYDQSYWPDIRRVVLSDTTMAYIQDISRALQEDLTCLLNTTEIRPDIRSILLSFKEEVISLG